LRIALFTDVYYPLMTGVVTSVMQLREGLMALGHEVNVFTVRYKGFRVNEPGVYRYPNIPISFGKQKFGYGIVSARHVIKVLEESGVDLIHAHSEFALHFAARKAANRFKVPYVHTFHTMWGDYLHYIPGGVITPEMVKKLYRKRLALASAVVAPSVKAHNYVRGLFADIPISIIPNGINIDKFKNVEVTELLKADYRGRYGVASDERMILFVGRITPEKRVKELQKAVIPLLHSNPKYKMAFVGNGGDLEALKEVARAEGLTDQFIFPGFIEWKDIFGVFSIASVYATCSMSEVHPMTVIEALVCALPVVSRRDDSYVDQVIPGENGYLVDTDEELTSAIGGLLADENKLRAFSVRSKVLSQRFTAEGHVASMEKLYEQVIGAFPGRMALKDS